MGYVECVVHRFGAQKRSLNFMSLMEDWSGYTP